MTEYALTSLGKKIVENVVMIHPLVAFNTYVYHVAKNDSKWVEQSRKVSDTNMSMREWAGLVIHSLALMNLTKQNNLEIGKDFVDGDGVIVKKVSEKELEGVFVEQTLVTYKAHTDITEGIAERIKAKSDKGKAYAWNKHLIVWCNINGDFEVGTIAALVKTGRFNVVNVIGFNGENRLYKSLLFNKDEGLINEFGVLEVDIIDDKLNRNLL
jgi:hypothetical protein